MSTPVVLEFGSHSLKVHYRSRSSGIFRKVRFAWDLGHEVYSEGRISERTTQKALDTILELRQHGVHPRSVLAIATGALRDAQNCQEFLRLLEEKLELRVRVISGREEASLLAQGYLDKNKGKLPALISDIGGGSLEIVYLGEDKTVLRDSLPLGAIRMYHFGLDAEGRIDTALVSSWIEECFRDASVIKADEVHCTGGTAKAVAAVIGRPSVSRGDLLELEDRVRRDGPPAELEPDRGKVFLPGLMVLRRLVIHAGASTLTHLKVPVGRIFLQRFARRIVSHTPEGRNYLLNKLRITQIYGKDSTAGLRSPPGEGAVQ
ncbi:MAG: hypothetical protein JXA90_03575 [Planctomycetes bacterium]|nr:hypothetical protein [Planctomycetota bacterium]